MNDIIKELDPKSPYYRDVKNWIKNSKKEFRKTEFQFFDYNDLAVKDYHKSISKPYAGSSGIMLDPNASENLSCFSTKTASPLFLILVYLMTEKQDHLKSFSAFIEKYRHFIDKTEWVYFYCLTRLSISFHGNYIPSMEILVKYDDIYDFDTSFVEMGDLRAIDFMRSGGCFSKSFTDAYLNLPLHLILELCDSGKIEFSPDKLAKCGEAWFPSGISREKVPLIRKYCLEEIAVINRPLYLTVAFLNYLKSKTYNLNAEQGNDIYGILKSINEVLSILFEQGRADEFLATYSEYDYAELTKQVFKSKYFDLAHILLEKRPDTIKRFNIPVSYFYSVPEEFEFCRKLSILSDLSY